MSQQNRRQDEETMQVEQALRQHFPHARIEAYRYNPYSIRVRVVDEGFEGQSQAARQDRVEKVLESLPEQIASDITMLVLVSPAEQRDSLMNREFENPSRSLL